MADRERGRTVYSTGVGRVCPICGWPAADCHCSSKLEAQGDALPDRPTAKLRLETKGRGGKSVTVVDGLPRNPAFVGQLATELKKACGTGGTAGDGSLELQGDRRAKVRELLTKKGFLVKG